MTPKQVLAPSEWSAKVNYDLWTDRYVAKDKVIVHYGGNASFSGDAERAAAKGYGYPTFEVERAVLRIYEQSHLSRGWRGLAYGWAIGQSGLIYRIRGWNSYGAHKGDLELDGIKENLEGIPVLFLLGGAQVPMPQMFESLEWLIEEFEAHEKRTLPVYGHQEIAKLGTGTATGCPGKPTMAYIENRRTAPSAPVPEPIKEEDDDMSALLAIFAKWSREDLIAMGEAGYWDGVDNVDWYFDPRCGDDEKLNLVVHILANGNKDIPGRAAQGPAGPAGADGRVEVFIDGRPVS